MNDVFKLPVHPSAEVFPMLPPDELAELADDIKRNGLAHPIVVKDGTLIDGRNRREACRIAGVEPRTVELNGQDATAYILSSNIARRHLTKGQRAMAVAMLYPVPGLKIKPADGLNKGSLSQARTVLRQLPEVAHQVMAGDMPLNDAYELARAAEDEASIGETERKHKKAAEAEMRRRRLDAIAEVDAELADAVRDGRAKLVDAEKSADEKRQKIESMRVTAGILLQQIDGIGAFHRKPSFREQLVQQVAAQVTAEHQKTFTDAADFIAEILTTCNARNVS